MYSGRVQLTIRAYDLVVRWLLPVAIVAVAALGAAARAGNYQPPPGDGAPQWISNSALVFRSGGGTTTVNAVGDPRPHVIANATWTTLAAPTKPLLAYRAERAGNAWLAVSAVDGSNERLLVEGNFDPIAWQSDSSRIFFGDSAGSLTNWDTYRVSSIQPDGTGLIDYPPPVHGIPSPTGTHFAYTATNGDERIHLVDANGRRTGSIGRGVNPVWSPDGSRIAFWDGGGRLNVARIGGAMRSFSIRGYSNATIVWSPDGRSVYAGSENGLLAIDLATGKRRTLAGIPAVSGAVLSPEGTRIAYAAGGECRDRVGIYAANTDGTQRRRLSNSCRIVGTDGPDVLHADFSRVVLGLGANDTLIADDTQYYFEGNTLIGGTGNDTLQGGYAQDTLIGGRGNDALDGGPSIDILIGGPSYDRINGHGGGDTVGARDGERDWVSCGRNGYGKDGRDTVYADRTDVVSPDCEIVHRR
jgi:Ca2+-binding RTX toxin-like protein